MAKKSFKKRKFGRRFKKRRFGSKRFGFKRRHKWKASRLVNKRPSLISDRYFTKLKYVDHFNTTYTSGVGFVYSYRGNSLFDPDFTGTGHQPYGFDQLSALYHSYRVYGSKIRVGAMQWRSAGHTTGAEPETFMDIGVFPYTQSSPPFTGFHQMKEVPYFKFRQQASALAKGSGVIMKSFGSTTKVCGEPSSKVKYEDGYAADVTANPAIPWFWHIIVDESTDQGNSIRIEFDVDLTYYCEFYDRKDPGQS